MNYYIETVIYRQVFFHYKLITKPFVYPSKLSSIYNLPPCFSTIKRDITSPNPLPFSPVRALSPFANGSNIFSSVYTFPSRRAATNPCTDVIGVFKSCAIQEYSIVQYNITPEMPCIIC